MFFEIHKEMHCSKLLLVKIADYHDPLWVGNPAYWNDKGLWTLLGYDFFFHGFMLCSCLKIWEYMNGIINDPFGFCLFGKSHVRQHVGAWLIKESKIQFHACSLWAVAAKPQYSSVFCGLVLTVFLGDYQNPFCFWALLIWFSFGFPVSAERDARGVPHAQARSRNFVPTAFSASGRTILDAIPCNHIYSSMVCWKIKPFGTLK